MAWCARLLIGGVAASSILISVTSKSQAGSFVADFTCKFDLGRALNPMYYPSGQANGFTYAFGKGSLAISQTPGNGNSSLVLSSTFPVSGDFSASVTVSRPKLGNAELGIFVYDQFGNPLIDDFYQNNFPNGFYGVTSNVFSGGPKSSLFSSQSNSDTSTTTTFTISRTGNVLSAGYNDGSGLVPLNSSPNISVYGVPATFGLFLIEEHGDSGAHQGSFSGLNISATSLGATCTSPRL